MSQLAEQMMSFFNGDLEAAHMVNKIQNPSQ